MSFKAVLFDFYGTLAHAEGTERSVIDLAAERGYPLPEPVVAKWRAGAWYGLEHREHSVSRDAYLRYRRVQRRTMLIDCGIPDDDVDALLEDVDANDVNFVMQAYDESIGVLTDLRARGLRLAICSNWDWDLDRGIATAGLTGLVDAEVTSAQVGCRKPHPDIYESTLRVLDVKRADALFVGDTWEADVEGPIVVGMTAVHIHRGDHHDEAPPLPDGVRPIADLRELRELV